MVEIDTTTEIIGADGPVPFLDLFQGRDELVIYHHMKDTVYLKARGISFAVLTSGRWDEVAPFVAFMGYAQPWSFLTYRTPAGATSPPKDPSACWT